jgi:hypothetical protein
MRSFFRTSPRNCNDCNYFSLDYALARGYSCVIRYFVHRRESELPEKYLDFNLRGNILRTFPKANAGRVAPCAVTLCLLLSAGAARAQRPAALAANPIAPTFKPVPKIEDVTLYDAFFKWHQSLIDSNDATKGANPAQSTSLDQQMAALLQLDPKDLSAAVSNTKNVTQAYAALTAKQAKYVATPIPGLKVSPTAAQAAAAFNFQRLGITVDGVRTLNQAISPASWAGIHGYITGTFKATVYKH